MVDRIDEHPTARDYDFFDERSGKDRRMHHTMLDPEMDKRKKDRRRLKR